MKITEKHLRRFHDRLEGIVDEIQELADYCSLEEGDTGMARALWTTQQNIEDAKEIINI